MSSKNDEASRLATLREHAQRAEQAEHTLGGRRRLGKKPATPEAMQEALHELRVNQIQLEMQNEELRSAQEDLERSRVRYFDLYENAPVGYLSLDKRSTIVEANLTVAGLLGVGRSKLIDHRLTEYIVSDDQDIHFQHSRRLFETGEPQVWEIRLIRRHLAPFWVRLEASIVPSDGESPICRAILSDVDERRRAEDALQEQRRVLDDILEYTLSGTWDWDLASGVQHLSPSFKRMLGHPEDSLPSSPAALRSVIFGADLATFQATIDRHLELGGSAPFATVIRCEHRDGSTVWVTCAGRVIDRAADGSATRLAGCIIDISELKQLESDRLALQRRLDRELSK